MSEAQFAQAHRDIDRDVAAAQERAAAAAAYRQKLDQMRGTASADGVTVTVDPSGALMDISLPHDLRYQSGEKLARSVMKAFRAAYGNVASKVREEAAATFGADSAVTQRMGDELAKRAAVIGEPDAEPGARAHPRW